MMKGPFQAFFVRGGPFALSVPSVSVSSGTIAGQVPDYALSAFNWALAGGIVQGNAGCLMPSSLCTRAQIVTFLYRPLGE